MKRLFALLLVIAMIVSFQTTVFAQEQEDGNVFVNEKYGYEIECSSYADGSIVRVYNNETVTELRRQIVSMEHIGIYDVNIPADLKYNRIKCVLVDLGMSERAVEKLSEKSLEDYCKAETISVTDTMSTRSITMEESELYQDETMRILLMASYMPAVEYNYAAYKLSAYTQWIDNPSTRSYDCVGLSVSQGAIFSFGTAWGWLDYIETDHQNNDSEELVTEYIDDFRSNINNNTSWDGCAMVYDLPNDQSHRFSHGQIVRLKSYSDFESYFECVAQISQYTIPLVFAAAASYDHMTLNISLSPPELSISAGWGANSVTIGFSASLLYQSELRPVRLANNISYEPIFGQE